MLTPKRAAAEKDLLAHLNLALKHALTGINQYFLHARMLKHKGFMKLADFAYKESLDTMKYTDQLVNLVLVQDGIPNLQELGRIQVGEAVPDILKNDLALVEATCADLKPAIAFCEAAQESASLKVLTSMLQSEEEHAAFLRRQLGIIDEVGINAYLQTQL